MNRARRSAAGGLVQVIVISAAVSLLCACTRQPDPTPTLNWYVYAERSGAFAQAARHCTDAARGRYTIDFVALPADASQQREQLVRRLAAGDPDIDIIGMDVIWTAEFAEAGWILPWEATVAREVRRERLAGATESAVYDERLWAMPFTTNTQLLWYRKDRVPAPPETWDEMIASAEALGDVGTIQAQGERYEGLTVFFVSLLASAGGSVLAPDGQAVSLEDEPTRRALSIMRRLANSAAADPALANAREDQARLAFESGRSSFMLNYTYVWPSARANAPEVAAHMAWARWPGAVKGRPSRVTVGGINLGIGAHSLHPAYAFEAATCIASKENQRLAATLGGLPPTVEALYDEGDVREIFPFADVLRETLNDAVQRPQTPLYSDLSLAISHTLHPLRDIDPKASARKLRKSTARALRSEGLL